MADEHVKSPTALDFADIAEVAAEEEEGDRSKALHADHEHLLQKGLSFALSQVAGQCSSDGHPRRCSSDGHPRVVCIFVCTCLIFPSKLPTYYKGV